MNFSSQATTINGLILCVPALVLAVIIVIMIPIVRVYIRDSNEGYPKIRNHGEGPY